jgi:hypothetical protein
MLTAFDYGEMPEQDGADKKIKNDIDFQRELDIAKSYAKQWKGVEEQAMRCPVCHKDSMELFYKKWGIPYYRCSHCYSVKAEVEEALVTSFQLSKALIEIRCCEKFQSDIAIRREQMWEEFIDWLSFRSFRYLGRNQGLDIIDFGTRYQGFIDKIKKSDLVKSYELRESILKYPQNNELLQADVVLCLDYLQQKTEPLKFFEVMAASLKDNGILVLRTRVGSGFDILTLRENNKNIYPFEHNFLPSTEGLQLLLEQSGLELLEMTTPGMYDVNYVMEHREQLRKDDYFTRYLLDRPSRHLADFQRFLQKSGMSSFSQVIARKKK